PRRSVLIAAIIEIALLSSTHVIALHTTNSLASRWVPYELGRAKARNITSLQAAGWFQKGQTVASCGDYVKLAVMTHDEPQVADWLQQTAGGGSISGARLEELREAWDYGAKIRFASESTVDAMSKEVSVASKL